MAHKLKIIPGQAGWRPRSQISRAIVAALHANRAWQSAGEIIDVMRQLKQLPEHVCDPAHDLHNDIAVRLSQALRCGHLERKDALRETRESGHRKPRKIPTALWRLKRGS